MSEASELWARQSDDQVIAAVLRLGDGGTLTPENFDANPLFADVLHDVIARHAASEVDLIEEARRLGTGKVYVIDGRTPTPEGAVPAADIIGSFRVDAGVVIPGSYERNRNHPWLHERLASELASRKVPDKGPSS